MFSFKKKEKIEVPLQIPRHIGIIMDGNGRWAKKRMQPRVFGLIPHTMFPLGSLLR